MMETIAFQSNIVNLENLSLSIHGSNQDKLRQIFEQMGNRQLNETEKEIIIRVVNLCECHEYNETRFLESGSFILYKRKVIKSTHPKK